MVTVPVKHKYIGDRVECAGLLGDATRVMLILERLMEFQGLQQYELVRIPYPGAVIKCSKQFGRREITISVGGAETRRKRKKTGKCLCFPHYSFAIITEVFPSADLTTADPACYYTALVCTGDGFVVKLEIVSSGWERYYVDQFVLVSIGEEIEDEEYPPLDCDRRCLMQSPRFPALKVVSLYIDGFMDKKLYITETDDLT